MSSLAAPAPGFLTFRFTQLPTALTIVAGVCLVGISLGILAGGARAMLLFNQWGKERGKLSEGKARLAGGLGGVVFGCLTSGSITAFLILLAADHQESPALSPYLAIVFLSLTCAPGGFVGGRYRRAARSCCALLGSLSLTLLVTLSFRVPSLLARLIIFLLLSIIALVLCHLPRTTHFLSVCAGLAGAYFFILGIDFFIHKGMLDAIGLLVATTGVSSSHQVDTTSEESQVTSLVIDWKSSLTKGLLAGWWLLAIASITWQWWWGGEDGSAEQAWDAYVASLAANASQDRRGVYEPPKSLWQRLLHPTAFAFTRRGAAGQKFTNMPSRRRRSPWHDDEAEDDDGPGLGPGYDDDDASRFSRDAVDKSANSPRRTGYHTKFAEHSPHPDPSSDEWDSDVDTLALRHLSSFDADNKPLVLKSPSKAHRHHGDNDLETEDDVVEYDLATMSSQNQPTPHTRPSPRPISSSVWSGSTYIDSVSTVPHSSPTAQPYPAPAPAPAGGRVSKLRSLFNATTTANQAHSRRSQSQSHSPTQSRRSEPANLTAVPATPSLIRALDRVRSAQQQARRDQRHTATATASATPLVRENEGGDDDVGHDQRRRASFDSWWAEVVERAKE